MKYHYTGQNRNREKVSGTIEAEDEIEAKMRLRAMQVRPLSLSAKKRPLVINWEYTIGSPVSLKALTIFVRQFSSLIDSGIAIVQCLDILFQQEKRGPFKKILGKVKDDIEGGSGLAESLAKNPKVFSEFFIRVVEAGEISGTLDKSLKRLGTQLEKLGRLKAKVVGALIYPLITFLMAIACLVFMLVKVIPEIAKLYSGSKLPDLTQDVLDLSQWFQTYYVHVFAGTAVLVAGSIFVYRMEPFRLVFDRFALKVPVFGSLILRSAVARFARTLGTLVESGVPLLKAFHICQRIIDNRTLRGCIRDAELAVAEGKSIATGLAGRKVFPPMVLHMIAIGELTGRLDELLGKVADIYDEEVDDSVSALTGLIQPAMLIIVGAMIAFLMLAMYMPVFTLGEKIAA